MKAKRLLYSALLAVSLTGGLSSCLNDLNVQPLDPTVNTAERAYQDAEDYANALSKLYAIWAMSGQNGAGSSDIGLGDQGNTTLVRSWFICQTMPTDEMKGAENNEWTPSLNYMNWTTIKTEPIEAVYQRCMYIVALVNDFLKQLPNAPADVDLASYEAQARFCRALAYYTLMDLFGNPPYITEDNFSIAPKQIGRAGIFNYVESELKALIEGNVLPGRNTGADRGRADKGSAWALLARMYLNAEVFTGTARYEDCMTACENVIAQGYSLASDYQALFSGDNTENLDAANEIIFPILLDGNDTQTYANLVSASRPNIVSEEIEKLVGDEKNAVKFPFCFERWGTREGWACYRGTSNLVQMFEFADNENPKADEIVDKRGIFVDKNYDDEPLSLTITGSPTSTFHERGWWVYKWTNLDHTGEELDIYQGASSAAFVSTDFPLFRLGDIYLMYAESAARTGKNLSTAVGYVNDLRRRGYEGASGYSIDESWLTATATVGKNGPSVQYGNILNERARELYWEGQRRTDLIRFGLFTGGSYLWEWKNASETGASTNARYNLYPIPQTDLQANGALDQNAGYED